tara:strand:- start:340 stop:492 length:153 start_codon:yes stop_codon:yes gene_type:complete
MFTIKLTEKELFEIKSLIDTVAAVMEEDEITKKQVKLFDSLLKRNKINKR